MLNNEILAPSFTSSMTYHLVNMQDPKPVLLCILRGDSTDTCVGGLHLEGGCKLTLLINTLQYRNNKIKSLEHFL